MFGQPEIDDCVTMTQFNELRQSMEERQERLTQDLHALMAEIRGRRQCQPNASNLGDDGEETAGAVARRRREQGRRNRGAAHDRRRGQGQRHSNNDESENVDDENHSQYRFGRRHRRGGNHEERKVKEL